MSRPPTFINPTFIPDLIDGYEKKGMSIRKLAEKFGYSYTAIRRALLDNNVTLRKRGGTFARKPLPPSIRQQIVSHYRQGHSQRSIAYRFGVSRPCIRRLVADVRGGPPRTRSVPDEIKDTVLDLYKQGHTLRAIERQTNCSYYYIQQIVREYRGLTISPADQQVIMRLSEQGLTPFEIAEHTNCSAVKVHKWLKQQEKH